MTRLRPLVTPLPRRSAFAPPNVETVIPSSVGGIAGNARPRNRPLKAFVLDRLFPGEGARTEMKALMRDYRTWCVQNGRAPLELSGFLDEIEKICVMRAWRSKLARTNGCIASA